MTEADEDAAEWATALALAAARRLAGMATVLLVIVSLLAAAGMVTGIVLLATAHDRARGIVGGSVALGSVLWWFAAALPCFAAEALARFIQMRATQGDMQVMTPDRRASRRIAGR